MLPVENMFWRIRMRRRRRDANAPSTLSTWSESDDERAILHGSMLVRFGWKLLDGVEKGSSNPLQPPAETILSRCSVRSPLVPLLGM